MDIVLDDQQDYIAQVVDRAAKLVKHGVWDGIAPHRLQAWLGGLANHQAELLGAYLLDNLCCRSRSQFASMLDTLFCNLRQKDYGLPDDGRLINYLRNSPEKAAREILLAPVISREEPPTKSGPYILRLAQRRFSIDQGWLTWPHDLDRRSAPQSIIFVDDFCGSGDQFIEFAQDIYLQKYHETNPAVKIHYHVATLHKVGQKAILDEFDFINLRYAERLDESHAVLSQECFKRYDIADFRDKVMEQYKRVVAAAGLPEGGYNKFGLAYTFAHATPDNTLPIFWKKTPNWTPLVDR